MPRAALLSIHARVAGTRPEAWEDPALVQLWGPRYSAYAVAAGDTAPFTLGRLPLNPAKRRDAEAIADRLEAFLDGRRLDAREAGRGLGMHANALRYAAPTGRVHIRWDGARQPTVWTVPAPAVDPAQARAEMARRFLHVLGPGTASSFGDWAGMRPPGALAAFEALAPELAAVRTSIGEGWILAVDEASFRDPPAPTAGARLLPSGDTYYLLQGADRELLVPKAVDRARLWTSRVWPGAVLLGEDIVGTWRRANAALTIEPWRRLTSAERMLIGAEAAALPLPGLEGRIRVGWAG